VAEATRPASVSAPVAGSPAKGFKRLRDRYRRWLPSRLSHGDRREDFEQPAEVPGYRQCGLIRGAGVAVPNHQIEAAFLSAFVDPLLRFHGACAGLIDR